MDPHQHPMFLLIVRALIVIVVMALYKSAQSCAESPPDSDSGSNSKSKSSLDFQHRSILVDLSPILKEVDQSWLYITKYQEIVDYSQISGPLVIKSNLSCLISTPSKENCNLLTESSLMSQKATEKKIDLISQSKFLLTFNHLIFLPKEDLESSISTEWIKHTSIFLAECYIKNEDTYRCDGAEIYPSKLFVFVTDFNTQNLDSVLDLELDFDGETRFKMLKAGLERRGHEIGQQHFGLEFFIALKKEVGKNARFSPTNGWYIHDNKAVQNLFIHAPFNCLNFLNSKDQKLIPNLSSNLEPISNCTGPMKKAIEVAERLFSSKRLLIFEYWTDEIKMGGNGLMGQTLEFLLDSWNKTLCYFVDADEDDYEDENGAQDGAGVGECYTTRNLYVGNIINELPEITITYKNGLHVTITRKQTFNFITTDGVLNTGNTGFEIYSSPFQPCVWSALLIFLMSTVFILSLYVYVFSCAAHGHENRTRFFRAADFFLFTFWLFRILMEQPHENPPVKSHVKVRSKSKPKSKSMFEFEFESLSKAKAKSEFESQSKCVKSGIFRAIFVSWLFASIFLVNEYRGFLHADFAVESSFKTKWTLLEQLISFDPSKTDRKNAKDAKENSNMFHIFYSNFKFLNDPSYFSSGYPRTVFTDLELTHPFYCLPYAQHFFAHLYLSRNCSIEDCGGSRMSTDCRYDIPRCREFYWAAKVLNFSTLVNPAPSRIKELIHTEFKRPQVKTAFLFPSQDFEYFWPIFQREMEKNPQLKFSHNRKVEQADDSFMNIQGFSTSNRLAKYRNRNRRGAGIIQRLERLMNSGIFWTWEKNKTNSDRKAVANVNESTIEKIGIGFDSQQNQKEKKLSYQDISFQNSAFHLVFMLLLYCFGVDMICFFVELTFTKIIAAF